MSPTARGRYVEERVALRLQKQGYVVLDRNWRTRRCELDLVMTKNGVIHVIEVKYRRSAQWGGGWAAISTDKARRLYLGAQSWVWHHGYIDPDIRLWAAVVTGDLQRLEYDFRPVPVFDMIQFRP